MQDVLLGILGGMGPEATSYFFQQLTKATPAKKDSEHIKTIIFSNPQIPDRTQAILYEGISPVKEMVKTARVLEDAGASMIFIPCFTAHHYYEEVQKLVNIPILNLLTIIKEHIEKNYNGIERIGILCTSGTKASKIFDKAFDQYEVLYSDEVIQEEKIMKAIYGEEGIKAGFTEGTPNELLIVAAKHLKDRGADIIVMGCTEIPLALGEDALDIPILNPMKLAAISIVRKIKG